MCWNMWLATIFSMIFNKKDKFDTMVNFGGKISGFKESFVKCGPTRAVFKDSGNLPLVREALTIFSYDRKQPQ